MLLPPPPPTGHLPKPPPTAQQHFDLIVPPALPSKRPKTFVSPKPTNAMLAERAADAAAEAAARRKVKEVPLEIRFLRLLESRAVQHNMTTPTVFHRVLRRRRSNPNRHFMGYEDVNPQLQCRLQCEMVGGGGGEVRIQVVWKPKFAGFVGVLNDMDVKWSSQVTEVVLPPAKEGEEDEGESEESEEDEDDDGDEDEEDEVEGEDEGAGAVQQELQEGQGYVVQAADNDDDGGGGQQLQLALQRQASSSSSSSSQASSSSSQETVAKRRAASKAARVEKKMRQKRGDLDVEELVARTREVIQAERAESQRKKTEKQQRLSQGGGKGSAAAAAPPKMTPWGPEPLQLADGSSSTLLVPRSCLQKRGCVHEVSFLARHRPSFRQASAKCYLKVSPKGSVWRCELETFEPFPDSDDDGDGQGGEDNSDDEDDEDEDDDQGPPDPFADVNAKPDKVDPYAAVDKTKDDDSKNKARGGAAGGDHVPGTAGGLVRGRYESDEQWGQRLEEEIEAATELRRSAARQAAEKRQFQLRVVEETHSVFDSDSHQVSGFTRQFLEQEVADEQLAKSKLENKWNGPAQDDLDDSELNLSGKAMERDDWDALGWILQRNWGCSSLNLSRCALDDKELSALLTSIRLNTVLTKVDLSRTRITDRGAKMCMDTLSSYRGVALRLKELDLRHCRNMTDLAGRHYDASLDELHPTLTKLCGLDLPKMKDTKETLDLSGIPLGLPEIELLALRVLSRKDVAPNPDLWPSHYRKQQQQQQKEQQQQQQQQQKQQKQQRLSTQQRLMSPSSSSSSSSSSSALGMAATSAGGVGGVSNKWDGLFHNDNEAGRRGGDGNDNGEDEDDGRFKSGKNKKKKKKLKAAKGPSVLIQGLGSVALTEVNLSRCGLGAVEATLVCSTLKRVGKLQIINLSGNALYLSGAKAVSDMVVAIPTLRILRLAHCRLQWSPEMVAKRALEKKSKKGEAGGSKAGGGGSGGRGSGGGAAVGFDPAIDYDPSALFVLADVSKRLKQIEECDLSEEDFESEPARQIRQSLAINRSLAYRRHVDLVTKVVPPLPDPLKEGTYQRRSYGLTLDVDSKFLVKEKLLHLNSVGITTDADPPPPLPRKGKGRCKGTGYGSDDDGDDQDDEEEAAAAAAVAAEEEKEKAKKQKGKKKEALAAKKGYFASGLQRLGEAAGKAAAGAVGIKPKEQLPHVTFQEGVFSDLSGGTDAFYFH